MTKEELVINWGFGLSLISWGVAGFFFNLDDITNSSVRIFVTLLNLTVGFLLIYRKPVVVSGSVHSILVSLPSLICGGLMFKLSRPLHLWEGYCEVIFIFGGIITFTSFLFLGRSFAILPNMRQIVSKGTFRIIRHPAYFGESLMVIACLMAGKSLISLIPFVIFIPGILFRIREEERLLSKNISYQQYQQTVKWRLLPFIW